MAGLEAVSLRFLFCVKGNQVLRPDFSCPMAVSAVVFLTIQFPFMPIGTGNIFGFEPVFAVDAPQGQRLIVDYFEFRLKVFYFGLLN